MSSDRVRVSYELLLELSREMLAKIGAGPRQAQVVADVMVWSDLIGRSTHGVSRLDIHAKRIDEGVLDPSAEPRIVKSNHGVMLVDGNEGFGHYTADFAMGSAIELAREQGVAAVAVRNSNFLGALAYYLNKAAESGMIGMAFTNSVPNVAAYGGKQAIFGTNPIGFSAPRQNNKHIMLDMATSSWSASAVRAALDQGKALPSGVAVDEDGEEITEPRPVGNFTLLPLGGAKGYGLSLFVEILSAVITGSGVSKGVASLFNDMTRSGDNGHLMIAINLSNIIAIEDYYPRIESLIKTIKSSNPDKEILYPGEKRWLTMEENLSAGIPLSRKTTNSLEQLSRRLNLTPPWPTPSSA
jgi:LDH2 family malate/lactate/ureidoglycolate dehydrogenase